MNAKSVNCVPPDREDRVVARSGACVSLSHDLFQALVERGLGVITLTHHRGLGALSLEVSIRTGVSEGVVGEAGRHEHDARQEDLRQGDCVDHPVADARNDFEERAFTRRAGGHGLEAFSRAQHLGANHSGRMGLSRLALFADARGIDCQTNSRPTNLAGFRAEHPFPELSKSLIPPFPLQCPFLLWRCCFRP